MRIINIVRKKDHFAQFKEAGDNIVLNNTDPDFESRLKEMAHKSQSCMGFDAVGGDLSGQMINAMPEGSELIVYGGLSGKAICGINALEVIFKGKIIRGFNLGQWKEDIGLERFQAVADELQELIIQGAVRTRIQGTFSLDEVQAALEQYIRNMSAGKVIFIP
jgi:NADPH:quinone reductase-like Zn-dependent oxidoreductase